MIMKRLVVSFVAGIGALGLLATAAAAQSGRCDSYARDYADSYANPTGNAVGGAVVGAVGGAILGGIIKGGRGAGAGAAIGGTAGALAGGAQGTREWQRRYDQAYDDCMAQQVRQQRPVLREQPVVRGAPEPWTDAWYDYCSARYRSFDPDTGYYRVQGGGRRFCR